MNSASRCLFNPLYRAGSYLSLRRQLPKPFLACPTLPKGLFARHGSFATEYTYRPSMSLSERRVKLVPPLLTPDTIEPGIVCKRPMRDEFFNISREVVGRQTRIHLYGHGGSGWTTLWGSVNLALEKFKEVNPCRSTPIRVLGSGCMGLTTAIELKRLGYKVSIYTKEFHNIPSWHAAGYFALVSLKTASENQKKLNDIGLATFEVYDQIEKGKHAYITNNCKETVSLLPVYSSAATETGLEDLIDRGSLPKTQCVTLDFGNNVVHKNFLENHSFFMNTKSLMRQLTATAASMGIPIEVREVQAFEEVLEPVLINCTGLGARTLNSDDKLIDVRGHLVGLNAKSGVEHMLYMIYTEVMQNNQKEYNYLFPASSDTLGNPRRGVLGGTFLPNVEKLSPEEQRQLDAREFQKLLDRNSLFFTGKMFPGSFKAID